MLYSLLNDSRFALAEALGLPTFEAAGMRLYRRLTFVARGGGIEKVLYPSSHRTSTRPRSSPGSRLLRNAIEPARREADRVELRRLPP